VVSALLRFIDRETVIRARGNGPIRIDYRVPSPHVIQKDDIVECLIHDARPSAAQLTLESSGFQLVRRPTGVQDWLNSDEVIRVYYEECKSLARELTGASQTFTFDHLTREPGRQIGGGGLFKRDVMTTAERGGGYISLVHMDYTASSTWNDYLALHGVSEPEGASRVIVLNFGRPLFGTAERQPLALCDARTVHSDDLLEMMLYGYGHNGYSWHDIGISVYQVARSPRQQWFYYSNMGPDEVLLIKTYDSLGVIGRGCPHTSFTNNAAPSTLPERRSIELRVLCYIDDQNPTTIPRGRSRPSMPPDGGAGSGRTAIQEMD
jgi:hypothetical protein